MQQARYAYKSSKHWDAHNADIKAAVFTREHVHYHPKRSKVLWGHGNDLFSCHLTFPAFDRHRKDRTVTSTFIILIIVGVITGTATSVAMLLSVLWGACMY